MASPTGAPAAELARETADFMTDNLSRALAAASHDFRSDTVTGMCAINLQADHSSHA